MASRPSSHASSHHRSHSSRSIANISVRSFSDFRARTSSIHRKPLPPNASPQRLDDTSFDDLIEEYTNVGEPSSATSPATVPRPLERAPLKYVLTTAQETRLTKALSPPIPANTDAIHNPSPPPRHSLQRAAALPAPLQLFRDLDNNLPILIHVPSETSDLDGTPSLFNVPLLSPDDMSLFQGRVARSASGNSIGSTTSTQDGNTRRTSPTNKFTSFFGWKNSPKTGQESPSTPFTDRSSSPVSSPAFGRKSPLDRSVSAPRLGVPTPLDIDVANKTRDHDNAVDTPCTPFPGNAPEVQSPVDELERELRDVTSELANSIRREMELEDENDRLKGDPSMYPEVNRRTSDYFSDSGSSAAKLSTIDTDNRLEELEKAKRKLEQEKAQIRADYAARFASEVRLRSEMQTRLNQLEQETRERNERIANGNDPEQRIKELETFLDEARRRLGQERQSHDNFEDLLAALRGELTQMRGERDNLVDEVVPQLKARIDGLEQEAAEVNDLRYENTRMQLEMGIDVPNRPRINSLAGPDRAYPMSAGLPRSSSAFAGLASPGVRRSNSQLQRSSSIKGRVAEFGESRDVEDQRDALQKALKAMIRRHEAQKREHARAIQRILADRETTPATSRPRVGFSKKVAGLKEEISSLRKRADEALSQKWQCEDNLGGVKMALDRAEQETRSTRAMLGDGVNSTGLVANTAGADDSPSMGKIIRRSIQLAETERDAARRDARSYRQKAQSSTDRRQRDQLAACADQLDQLAGELDACVRENLDLQRSLALALDSCETEQTASISKVVALQSRLKGLEDRLVSAQQDSDASFAANDDVAKSIDQTAVSHLARLRTPAAAPTSVFKTKAPRLDGAATFDAKTKTAALAERVADLEAAVLAADGQTERVMASVEASRASIAGLRAQRDAASLRMKELQLAISGQKQAALKLMA